MIYSYQCTNKECLSTDGEQTIIEAEASMKDFKEVHPSCTKCGFVCDYKWVPSVTNFILKDGNSGSWPSKGNRFKQYREKASQAATKRQLNRYGEPKGAVPNFQGQERESWREAQNDAVKEKGLEVAHTFNEKIREENSKVIK